MERTVIAIDIKAYGKEDISGKRTRHTARALALVDPTRRERTFIQPFPARTSHRTRLHAAGLLRKCQHL
jgi:hypothetical protein